jgi:hypothetical protein
VASIAFADLLNIERLPIDAQDIVTRVRLVIAGTYAGKAPTREIVVGLVGWKLPDVSLTYVPLPITYTYTDPLHTTYRCTRAFSLPEGFNPFLPPTSELIDDPTGDGFSDMLAVRDGDPETKATLTDPHSGMIAYDWHKDIVGWKLRYTSETSDGQTPVLYFSASRQRGVSYHADWELPNGENANDVYAVTPHDARNHNDNVLDYFIGYAVQRMSFMTGASTHTVMDVHEFYPLMLNESLLEDVAKANVRLPALLPLRITVRGYVPPDREHTIEGWPGGDYTGVVAQHQYDLGRTVIDFEQAGAPVGLPAEAIESARERKAAIDREVATASYSLRMGERQ